MSSFSVQIPQPCHERWSEMQPDERGRFCASCQKLVIDYTAFSDQELIKLLSKPLATNCGRFRDDQLNRPLVPATKGARPVWRHWLSLLTMSLFGWQAARAQVNQRRILSQPATVYQAAEKPVVSIRAIPVRSTLGPSTKWVVRGRIMRNDSSGTLLPVSGAYVSVSRSGERWVTQSDDTGAFSLPITTRIDTTAFKVDVHALTFWRGQTTFQGSPSSPVIELNDILLYSYGRPISVAITGGGIAILKTPSRWQRLKRKLFH
ncbi:hypothetical protein M0L20_10145 [Spirosoma sp. RP8]|uniref:Carboxypeptidase regulatory-like domain-containing protein n=1 Tax=Spirosoma liriopis TaxID=2937440 RepID=A0ABT0HJ81_9BACT|nr:hypothetical protein [Spirosoma liriopis]MCK8492209.1 hypothetical protein [Spirosoma liriopis]